MRAGRMVRRSLAGNERSGLQILHTLRLGTLGMAREQGSGSNVSSRRFTIDVAKPVLGEMHDGIFYPLLVVQSLNVVVTMKELGVHSKTGRTRCHRMRYLMPTSNGWQS